MNRMTPIALTFVLLCGCPTSGDDRLPQCQPPAEQDLNTVSGMVDGDVWSGVTSGFQLIAGPAMQVSATGPDDDGDSVNVVLRLLHAVEYSVNEESDEVEIAESTLILDALDDKAAPYDFELGDASAHGANATVTKTPPSMSTGEGEGSGFLRITSIGVPADGEEGDPEEVVGCFNLTASSQDGSQSVSVTEGVFRLTGS